MSDLKVRAEASLRANIESIDGGRVLSAGRNHFRTLWTRDFCFASRGLCLMPEHEVVKEHLELIFKFLRDDGLVPRVIDNVSTRIRVSLSCASLVLPFLPRAMALKGPLKPEYVDEHGTSAIDSNLLVLLAALNYAEKQQATEWLVNQKNNILKIYQFYRKVPKIDGLLFQAPFADWQDSVTREGVTFFTNTLYYWASYKLKLLGWIDFDEKAFWQSLQRAFWSEKDQLFFSMKGHPYFSLEAHLLWFDYGHEFFSTAYYQKFRKSEFYTRNPQVPGFNTFPSYPKSWRSAAVKVSGLGDYHGGIYWTWLMALAGKVAVKFQDQETYRNLLKAFNHHSEEWIYEILDPATLKPWSSWLYRSEYPFSWGSGMIVEMLHSAEQKKVHGEVQDSSVI